MNTTSREPDTKRVTAVGPCFRLIYRSHSLLSAHKPGNGAKASATEDEGLAEILRVARTNNARLGVTGALVLYDDWFAQVLEGPEAEINPLFDRIRSDARHNGVTLNSAGAVGGRLFDRWAMALVAEHGEPDTPIVATSGGLSEGAPWKVTKEQEAVLTTLRDLTRGYGRGS